MARDETDREDLLREATALVERIELIPRGALSGGHIIAGFRRNGALSVYFGEDPVYQFNEAGELRRAYCDGKLLKAVNGKLAALERVRTTEEVQLVRHELSAAEEDVVLNRMRDQLFAFAASLTDNAFDVVGRVPRDADVLSRLTAWLSAHKQWTIAAQPNA